jgi:hypothetical protein
MPGYLERGHNLLPMHHELFAPHFDPIQPGLLTAPLNKPQIHKITQTERTTEKILKQSNAPMLYIFNGMQQ